MPTARRLIIFALLGCAFCAASSHITSGAPRAKNVQARAVERVVHVGPPDANDSRYVYVPFDVPARATRVSVAYQYERAGGANTIDIGLFDARSATGADPRGFRGWSGGRRSELFLTRDEATPGYTPGALPAGTWRVILGLYRIAPAGVDVTLKIAVETRSGGSSANDAVSSRAGEPSPAVVTASKSAAKSAAGGASRRANPPRTAARGLRWWAGDLHMHTVHSDGNWTVAELIESARAGGLDFISVVDHNTASHHAEIERLRPTSGRPLVMRGEEITTYGGHANAWGLPAGAWIDFRVRAGDSARMARVTDEAHRLGALISINHPAERCGGCSWSYDASGRGFDGIEVWNGTWAAPDEESLVMWDKILRAGRRITAIASTDSHRQDTPIGQPASHVAARELTQTSILNAIREGHVYLTGSAERPFVSFEVETSAGKRRAIVGDEIRLGAPAAVRLFITVKDAPTDATISLVSDGEVIRTSQVRADGQTQAFEIECARDTYFRLEVRDKSKSMIALTNPVYVRVGARNR
ncbi:MAG: CehA/McbA family metallohydrolase [Acidobacteria bacterium]|nr:CehA/McbA family metallohydrolase [Acidobacteriota bacterium]MCA1641663.1 CehA/McbA family metallohydrolase [Acidobacteriota bacterium]